MPGRRRGAEGPRRLFDSIQFGATRRLPTISFAAILVWGQRSLVRRLLPTSGCLSFMFPPSFPCLDCLKLGHHCPVSASSRHARSETVYCCCSVSLGAPLLSASVHCLAVLAECPRHVPAVQARHVDGDTVGTILVGYPVRSRSLGSR